MKLRLSVWNGSHGIYSIAESDRAEQELKSGQLKYWRIGPEQIVSSPDGFQVPLDEVLRKACSKLRDFDVVEVFSDGTVRRCYQDGASDHVFLITERCNSNCIMCPSPESIRRKGAAPCMERLLEIAGHIPTDVRHFTITGGEPFLAGRQMFPFLEFLKKRFPKTEMLLLTNGRIFSIPDYCRMLKQSAPEQMVYGIPLHAADSALHDRITQTSGSFRQTMAGISGLLKEELHVELRIVVSRLNCHHLVEIAKLIAEQFPNVHHVCIMAMELTGNAYVNRQEVWIPYRASAPYVKEASDLLIRNGIDVQLYNFPLCTIDSGCWTLCRKSISEPKVRYSPECKACRVRDACGGVFAGTIRTEEQELMRIE